MAETSGTGRAEEAPDTATPEAGISQAGDAASAPSLPAPDPAEAPGALSTAAPKHPSARAAILLAGNSRVQLATAAASAASDTAGSVAERRAAEALIVDVEGFEGPLDLLLSLSRSQKVDLRRISVLQLAEQYLAFVEEARALRASSPRSIRLSGEFHILLAELTGSRLLIEFVNTVVSRSSLILARFGRPHSAECGMEEHVRLIDALRLQDRETAMAIMDAHLHAVEDRARVDTDEVADVAAILSRYAEDPE